MLNRNALYLIRYDTRFTYSLVALFIGMQSFILVPTMFTVDEHPDYYDTILPYVFSCEVGEFPERNSEPTRNPLTWWLRCASFTITENPDIFLMPFSIGVLTMTYVVGSAITKDRLVGIIAMGVLVFNPLWKDWASTQTYDMLWAFLLLCSIFLIIKSHQKTSALFFIIGSFAKSYTLIYLPVWLLMAIKRKQWYGLTITLGFVVVSTIVINHYILDLSIVVGNRIGFYPEAITESIIRTVSMIWPVMPLIIGTMIIYRFFKPSERIDTKEVFVWIFWSLLTTPIIHVFSLQAQYPYRFVILGVFISILLAISIIHLGRFIEENRQKKFLVK